MKHFTIALAVCLIALAAFVPGCGKKSVNPTTVAKGQQTTPAPSAGKPGDASKPDTDPTKTLAFNAVVEEQIGVPIYPGAKSQNDFSTGADDKKNEVLMVSFTTKDSMGKVMSFYRKALKGYTESDVKVIKGAKVGGFRHIVGDNSEMILVEQPAKGPVKIAMTITKAAKAKIDLE